MASPHSISLSTWLFALAAVGCAATPMPEPPESQLPAPNPELIGLGAQYASAAAKPGEPEIFAIPLHGEPDAVTAGALLEAINLDEQGPPVATSVTDNGSFDLSLPLQSGQWIRFTVRQGDHAPSYLDRIFADGKLLEPHQVSCLQATRELDWVYSGAQTAPLKLTNRCALPLVAPIASLRIPDTSIRLPEMPATLEPGASCDLTPVFTTPPSPNWENHLKLDGTYDGGALRQVWTLRSE